MSKYTVKETMGAGQQFGVVGCDPGPTHSAIVLAHFVCEDSRYKVTQLRCAYFANENVDEAVRPFIGNGSHPLFLAVEICGSQFRMVGASVFDTAAMGGVVRHACKGHVNGIYCMRSSEWRHALTGAGNSRAPMVYDEIKRFFEPNGKGSDPYKGIAAAPGPLWDLFEAGKGGNAEHLKDALGCAIGLTRVAFRTGQSPEQYRREW